MRRQGRIGAGPIPLPRNPFMNRRISLLASLIFSAAAFVSWGQAEDWPGFRGAKGGLAPDQDLPAQVTKDNVLWKIKMPGVGTSSPILSGDKVFVTAYT